MGLKDFWKKKNDSVSDSDKEKDITGNTQMLQAMPVFVNNRSYDLDKITEHLRSFWKLNVIEKTDNNETVTLNIENTIVTLAYAPVSIAEEYLNEVVPYSYLWKNAAEELKTHTGYATVSITEDKKTIVEQHFLLSKILCSILMTSDDCIGIYQRSRKLLLQKDFYLSAVDDIKNNRIPVPAWIYIGLKRQEEKYDAYTFGMDSFGKQEIEIIGSDLNPDNLYKLILSLSSYIIGNDITFEDGDAFRLTENILIKLKISEGVYANGLTLKPQI